MTPLEIQQSIDRGVDALVAAQDPDGHLGERLSVRDSAATAEAIALARPASPALGLLSIYLGGVSLDNVDDLSRVSVWSPTAGSTALLLSEQNDDGGYGLTHEYGSDELDTSLALRALVKADERAAAQSAVKRLIKFQAPDGSWGEGTARAASTAEAAAAIGAYRNAYGSSASVDLALTRGADWLATNQQVDGTWVSGAPGPRATASSLFALASSNLKPDSVGTAAAHLVQGQLIDGTWGGAFETALAVRALVAAKAAIERDQTSQLPDPSIRARDISVSAESVETGRPVTVDAAVGNDGTVTAESVVAEFFLADPTGGADPVATAPVPAIAPGQQVAVQATFSVDIPQGRHRIYVVLRPLTGQDRELSNNSTFVNLYVRISRKSYEAVKDWPRPGHDIQRSGNTPNNLHAGIDPTPTWRVPADGGHTVAQGMVFYGHAGLAKAVNAKTGAAVWQVPGSHTDPQYYKPPIYNRGHVYLGYPGAARIVNAATGAQLMGEAGGIVGGGPLMYQIEPIPSAAGYDPVFIWIPPDTSSCSLGPRKDPTAGSMGVDFGNVWPASQIYLDNRPCAPKFWGFASDGTRGFATGGPGYVVGFDLARGEGPNGEPGLPLWDRKLTNVLRAPAPPLVDSLGQVVAAGWEGTSSETGAGRVVALSSETGEEYWSFATDAKLDGSPIEYKGTIIVIDRSGRLYALDQITGALKWSWQADGYTPAAPMPEAGQTLALSRHYLYVPHPDGRVYTLDVRTGETLTSTVFSGRPYELAIDDTNNTIYVHTQDGFISAHPTHELPEQCAPDPANSPAGLRKVVRVSEFTDGSQIPGRPYGGAPAMSADGRYVAFSMTTDNGTTVRLFVRDLLTGVTTEEPYTEQVSQYERRTGGFYPSLSADGRYIAFASNTYNEFTGQRSLLFYMRDRQTGATEPLLKSPTGDIQYFRANENLPSVDLTDDAGVVAYSLDGNDTTVGDTDNSADVFALDRATQQRSVLSMHPGGIQTPAYSSTPSISADGRFVVFSTAASLTNTPVASGEFAPFVYLYDRALGQWSPISVNSAGKLVNGTSPQITPDGRYVTFSSGADSLVPPPIPSAGFGNHPTDSYIHDRQNGTTDIVSVNTADERSLSVQTANPTVSADGRYVAFSSFTILAKGDSTNLQDDVVVRDRSSGTTELVSQNPYGVSTAGVSTHPTMSPDGSRIAFNSTAGDLVDNDTDGLSDVFVFDRNGWAGTGGTPPPAPTEPDPGCPPVYDPEAAPFSDLAVEPADIVAGDLEQGQAGEVSVSVSNDGDAPAEATTVRLYDGDSSSGDLIGEQPLGALAAGADQTLSFNWANVGAAGSKTLTAVVDPERLVFEQNVANNEAETDTGVAAPRVGLGLTTDKPAYEANEDVAIESALSNTASASRTIRLTVALEDTEGEELDQLDDSTVVLGGGQSMVVPTSWNTLDTTAGTYVVRARVASQSGEILAEETTAIEVVADVQASLAVDTDQLSYGPGEDITLQGLARNTSANGALAGSVVELAVSGPGGTPVESWNLPAGEIPVGAATLVAQSLSADGLAPGDYTLTGTLRDAGAATLSQSTTTFSIDSSAETGDGLRGSLTADPDDPYKFTNVDFDYSVTNNGNADVSGATARIRVSDLTTGQTVKTLDTPISAATGGTATSVVTTVADMTENRDYQVSLHLVLAGGQERPLDRAIIRVRPVPFTYGASLSASPANRVLVWACDPRDEQAARAALGDTLASFVPDRSANPNAAGCSIFNTDEEREFLRQMRSGNYNQYWILGAHKAFGAEFGDEVAARVIQGDGLVVAGGDTSLDLFHWCGNKSPLGANYAGSLSWGTYTIKFGSSTAFSGLDSVVTGAPTRVTTTTASSIGTTTYSTWLGTKTGITATYNQFGSGKAVYIGAAPASFADQGRAASVLTRAGTTVASTSSSARGGGLARLDLFTEGIAPGSPLELRTTLPGNSAPVGAPVDTVFTGGVLRVPFSTAGTQRKERSVWLKLPTTGATAATSTTAYFRDPADNQMKPYGMPFAASIQIAEDRQAAKTAAVNAVNAITGVSIFDWLIYQKIKDDVASSISATSSSSTIWWRLQALVDDIGTLENVGWGARETARQAIARLVTYVQYDYYLATGGN